MITRRTLLLLLAVGLFAGCVGAYDYRVGYREFYVEFEDPVIDSAGRLQFAYCADRLTFRGDIDTRCNAQPMTWNYAGYAFVRCSYLDSNRGWVTYDDEFYFAEGTIRERDCNGRIEAAQDDPRSPYERSTQSRNASDQVLLPDEAELSEETNIAEARSSRGTEGPGILAVGELGDESTGYATGPGQEGEPSEGRVVSEP